MANVEHRRTRGRPYCFLAMVTLLVPLFFRPPAVVAGVWAGTAEGHKGLGGSSSRNDLSQFFQPPAPPVERRSVKLPRMAERPQGGLCHDRGMSAAQNRRNAATPSASADSPTFPETMLDSGPVRGRREGALRIFRGIPYAAPPVGNLRWRPPQPVVPWTSLRDCGAFGPSCPQPRQREEEPYDEDCLTLNVWTPSPDSGAKLPVMVWIHGGGFHFGSSSQREYNGALLAQKGVVVVTLNYRLGPLGFLVHPALSRESEHRVSGNYGLLDQIAALEWVQRNIAAFGGDRDRVTIFGQSAGSRSVGLLVLSPRARGLFRQAIAQSGGPLVGSEYLNPLFSGRVEQVSRMGEELASLLCEGRSGDVLETLRALPAQDIVRAEDCHTGLFDEGLFFAPVFDGWVLPSDSLDILEKGIPHPVPMILGSTLNEGTLYLAEETDLSLARYDAFLQARFGSGKGRALEIFEARQDAHVPIAMDRLITAGANAWPARLVARSLARRGVRAYLYQFTRRPRTEQALRLGAHHGVELPYVFGTMTPSEGYDRTDQVISQKMMDAWVRFAQTGDPNGPGLPEWPVYAPASDLSLEFGDVLEVRHHVLQKPCDFFDALHRCTRP